MNKKIYSYTLIVIAILAIASACGGGQEKIIVKDAWARPGLEGGNSGVFLTIENHSGVDDQLLNAVSNISSAVELHKTIMEDGVMKMKQQVSVPIPANEQIDFKPGDLHIMLIELKSGLNVGDEFDVSLDFEHAGEIDLTVIVKEP